MFVKKINMRLVSILCLVVLILTSVDQAHAGVFTPTVLPFAPEAESVISTVAASPSGANPTQRDIMLVIDTSMSMAFATDGNPTTITDDPAACNASLTCQPMETVKSDAMDFVDLLTFPADRVGIVTMTSQSLGGSREPMLVLPLTNDKTAIQNALSNFKSKRTRVLVATDIAARGIDVDELTHVINFEISNIAETYVHRIGRTGRAGASGIAISFCDMEEKEYLRDIQKLTGKIIPIVEKHPFVMNSNDPVTFDGEKKPFARNFNRNANAAGRRTSSPTRNGNRSANNSGARRFAN